MQNKNTNDLYNNRNLRFKNILGNLDNTKTNYKKIHTYSGFSFYEIKCHELNPGVDI